MSNVPVSRITDHIDSTMAQTLATRAYQAVNRVCVGKAKKVRFRSRGRGIDSVQGKRNDVGMRFVLDPGVGGRSIGLRAPGMFVAHLERLVAKTGGTLNEISAFKTKLSQYCHHCGTYHKKPRSQRWHVCSCGLLPVQRDLYSAFLLASLDPEKTTPSVTQSDWEGAEPRLHAEIERLRQRASEGQILHRSMGVVAAHSAPRARARRQQSPANPHQELALLIKKQEAVGVEQEPPCLEAGEVSVSTI